MSCLFFPVLKHVNLLRNSSAYVVVVVFKNVKLILRLSLEMLFSAWNHVFLSNYRQPNYFFLFKDDLSKYSENNFGVAKLNVSPKL